MKNSKLSIDSKTTFVYLFMIKGLISTDVCSGPLRAERRRREARREKCTFNKCTLPTIPSAGSRPSFVKIMKFGQNCEICSRIVQRLTNKKFSLIEILSCFQSW